MVVNSRRQIVSNGWGFSQLITLFSVAYLSVVTPVVYAQSHDSVGLSIVPAIVDLPLASSNNFSIQVTNITAQALPVNVGVRALIPLDPTVDPNQRQRYDASQWITPSITDLLLEPHETTSVAFGVAPPSDAGPGGHYALVTFRVLTPEGPLSASNAQVNPEVTSIIMLGIPGELIETASLGLVEPSRWQWTPQRSLAYDFVNTGNLHLLPQSRILALDLAGRTVETLPVASHLVLPGTASRFAAYWRPAKWGIYRYKVESSFGTPLKLLDATSQIFIVWPPIWIQLVGLSTFVGLGMLMKRVIVFSHRRLRRPRRLASDTGAKSRLRNLASSDLDELSRSEHVKDVSRKKR